MFLLLLLYMTVYIIEWLGNLVLVCQSREKFTLAACGILLLFFLNEVVVFPSPPPTQKKREKKSYSSFKKEKVTLH